MLTQHYRGARRSTNKFTYAHEGFCLRLSYILRPIWEHEIYRLFDIPHSELVGQLESLLRFLETHMLGGDYAHLDSDAAKARPRAHLMFLIRALL